MNIYPIFDRIASRKDKERQLRQRGITLWIYGLSGSGKSTIAAATEQALQSKGYLCRIIDGDNMRNNLNSDLGFSAAERSENIRRTAEVCRLFTDTGIITIASTISPTAELRATARRIVGCSRFIEVFIATPLVECERRDTKGLYAAARQGLIGEFTGISAPFEPAVSADITLDTSLLTVNKCVDIILNTIKPHIEYGEL